MVGVVGDQLKLDTWFMFYRVLVISVKRESVKDPSQGTVLHIDQLYASLSKVLTKHSYIVV